MQKKLIALAVASLVSAPVFAQSQVSVYGVIDQAIDSGNYGAGNVTRLTGSGYTTERLGFKGSEDMGNGMKANFILELGQRTDTGMLDNANNQLFQRAATVGLSGSWGQVNFGRQYTPIFSIQAANDIFRVAGVGSNYSLTNIGQTRANNSIRYDSANMSGFTAAVMYALGDTNVATVYQESTLTPKDLGRHTGLNLRYANGPLALGLGWSSQKAFAVVAPATTPATTKSSFLIGSYDFKVVAINAGWGQTKNDTSPVTVDGRVWTIGASMPVFGKDTVKFHYNNSHNKLVTNTDAKLIALGYVHPMSKRTTLYGTWSKMTNETGRATTLFGAPAITDTAGAANLGYDPSSLQVGISHAF